MPLAHLAALASTSLGLCNSPSLPPDCHPLSRCMPLFRSLMAGDTCSCLPGCYKADSRAEGGRCGGGAFGALDREQVDVGVWVRIGSKDATLMTLPRDAAGAEAAGGGEEGRLLRCGVLGRQDRQVPGGGLQLQHLHREGEDHPHASAPGGALNAARVCNSLAVLVKAFSI